MADLYNGKSEGFRSLVDGYMEYSRETIANRAFPDFRDGLKPVHRRILYSMYKNKINKPTKSAKVVGDVMGNYHPHGNTAIYEAMVRMTDKRGNYNVPLIKGTGNMGNFFSTESAAAERYTEVQLGTAADDFFKTGMNILPMVETEFADGSLEPAVLPARYPMILVNGAEGMAVGMSTSLPSFNFWDVLDLYEKYVKTGFLNSEDMIYPDFPTGGHYIEDRTEALRIMLSGKGRIKMRADVDIKGNQIFVREIPFGLSVEKIRERINQRIEDGSIYGLSGVYDSHGHKSDYLLTIKCKSKSDSESVLVDLYRAGILQKTFQANMMAVRDNHGDETDKIPIMSGVYGILYAWVEWRKEVLTRSFTADIDSFQDEYVMLDYFIQLVDNPAWKENFLARLTKTSNKAGLDYLHELFPDITDEHASWISKRSANVFLDGGPYRNRYMNIQSEIQTLKGYLNDLNGYLLKDIDSMRKEHRGLHARRSKVTQRDYKFSKQTASSDQERTVDTSMMYFTIFKDGFLKKTSTPVAERQNILNEVHAPANATLIGFDNIGRLIRIYGDEIPITRPGSVGTYIFSYIGDNENPDIDKNKHVLYMGHLDGSTRMLIFTDGKVSFLQTSKWLNAKARYKVVNNGVSEDVVSLLLDVVEEADIPENLFVADAGKPGVFRYGILPLDQIRRGSSAKSKIKAFGASGNIDIKYWGSFPTSRLYDWLGGMGESAYMGRIKALPGNPDDPSDVTAEGIDFLEYLNEPTYSSIPII